MPRCKMPDSSETKVLSFESWIREHGIGEVECLVPDMNGIVRGKVFPAQKFLKSERDGTLRIPSSIYALTVTGEYAEEEKDDLSVLDPDVILRPDLNTIRVAPGYRTPDRKSTRLNSSHSQISYA